MANAESSGKKDPDAGYMSRLEKLFGGWSGQGVKGVNKDCRSATQKILKGKEEEGDLPEGWEDYLRHAEAALRRYAAEQGDRQQEVWGDYQALLTKERDEQAGTDDRIEAMAKILAVLKQTRDSGIAGRDRDLKEIINRAVQKAPVKLSEALVQGGERRQQRRAA